MFFLLLLLLCHSENLSGENETERHMKIFTKFNNVGNTLSMNQAKRSNNLSDVHGPQQYTVLNTTGTDSVPIITLSRRKKKDVYRSNKRRTRRFAFNYGKLKKKNLTYRILSYPPGLSKDDVQKQIQRAYDVWSSFTDFTFTYQERDTETDLTIEFPARRRHPNCHRNFDGKGKVLAHTFPPLLGSGMHFDPAEDWTTNNTRGTNIFPVAVHEIGHSLGLSHSTHPESLMAPVYKKPEDYYYPSADDIEGIQELYGPRTTTQTPLLSTDMNILCQNFTYDTIFKDSSGKMVYIFSGAQYWVLKNTTVQPGYPRNISEQWIGLPRDLDAAYTTRSGSTYFFKGNKHWKFREFRMVRGYPRLLRRGFPGVPNSVDAAFETAAGDAVFFYKGRIYLKFLRREKQIVEVQLINQTWHALPNDLNAVLSDGSDHVYFFKEGEFYKYRKDDSAGFTILPEYPKSIQNGWLRCQELQNTIV